MSKVKILLLRRWYMVGGAALLAAAAIFYAVNYPASVGAAATTRQLPIYSVERSQKVCAISFDAAWGDAKVRQFTENCRTLLLCFYDSINASYLQQDWFKKVKAFLIGNYGQKRCRTTNCRYLFCDFSRETKIGAKEKYSGN